MPRRSSWWTVIALAVCTLASVNGALATLANCGMMREDGSCCCHSDDSARESRVRLRTGACCCTASTQDLQTLVAEAPNIDSRSTAFASLLPVTTSIAVSPTQPRAHSAPPRPKSCSSPPLFLQTGAFLI